jgi:hypothetical protein
MGDDGRIFIRDEFLDAAFEAASGEEGPLRDMPGIPLLALSDIKDNNRSSGSELGVQLIVRDCRDSLSGCLDHVSSSESHRHAPSLYP